MATKPLSHSEFFSNLTQLFGTQHGADPASVYLTQKRLSHDPTSAMSSPSSPTTTEADVDSLADLHPPNPLPILIRATNGASKRHRDIKIKLSTVVLPTDLEGFYVKYAECCRAGMVALRKRDRKGRKQKDKKKKGKGTAAGADATKKG